MKGRGIHGWGEEYGRFTEGMCEGRRRSGWRRWHELDEEVIGWVGGYW